VIVSRGLSAGSGVHEMVVQGAPGFAPGVAKGSGATRLADRATDGVPVVAVPTLAPADSAAVGPDAEAETRAEVPLETVRPAQAPIATARITPLMQAIGDRPIDQTVVYMAFAPFTA
jgi:hypothetical protein